HHLLPHRTHHPPPTRPLFRSNPCPPRCCLIVNCAPVFPSSITSRSISEIVPIGSAEPASIRISFPCRSGRSRGTSGTIGRSKIRSEEHTSELQSRVELVSHLL